MDWATIVAGLVALAGALLAYLTKSREAKEVGVLVKAQNEKIGKLEVGNVQKGKYIAILERELVARATPAELLGILNKLHAANRGDAPAVLPGTDPAVPGADMGDVRREPLP